MKYINEFQVGETITGVYLCKAKATKETKTGKPYQAITLSDKTGAIECRSWDPDTEIVSKDYDEGSFVEIVGRVDTYRDVPQLIIQRLEIAAPGTYDAADYIPTSDENIDDMWEELMEYRYSVSNPYLQQVLSYYFDSPEFSEAYKDHSAAKKVHHAFAGGLLQHTLGVTRNCAYMADTYPILNRDLLITGAIFHDIGKMEELSDFPENDYTDEGDMLGHIVIGVEMIDRAVRGIPDFPKDLEMELKHLIVSHHGKAELGSPKSPEMAEAVALNMADDLDAKMESLTELFKKNEPNAHGWMGYCYAIDSNVRRSIVPEPGEKEPEPEEITIENVFN